MLQQCQNKLKVSKGSPSWTSLPQASAKFMYLHRPMEHTIDSEYLSDLLTHSSCVVCKVKY